MLEKLIGLKGDENTLFEILQFEVESNYNFFYVNRCDVPLIVLENNQFQIEKILWRNSPGNETFPISEYLKKNIGLIS